MDKRSGITDEEFAALRSLPEAERKPATRDRAKLNQLKAPLGEAEFTKLQAAATAIRIMQAALEAGGDKLATAMKKAGVDTREAFTEKMNTVRARLGAGSIAELKQKLGVDIAGLKAKLGEDAVAAIANNDTAKQQLYAAHGVKDIAMTDVNSQPGVNLEIGQGNTLNLATSQFLQTKGNEAQARNKRELSGEIVAEGARREALRAEQKRRMANEGVIAAAGVVPSRAAPPEARDGDAGGDQIDLEGALGNGFDGDEGGPPVQDYDDLPDAVDPEAPDTEEHVQPAASAGNRVDLGSALRDGFGGDDEDRANQRLNDDDDLLG